MYILTYTYLIYNYRISSANSDLSIWNLPNLEYLLHQSAWLFLDGDPYPAFKAQKNINPLTLQILALWRPMFFFGSEVILKPCSVLVFSLLGMI